METRSKKVKSIEIPPSAKDESAIDYSPDFVRVQLDVKKDPYQLKDDRAVPLKQLKINQKS